MSVVQVAAGEHRWLWRPESGSLEPELQMVVGTEMNSGSLDEQAMCS